MGDENVDLSRETCRNQLRTQSRQKQKLCAKQLIVLLADGVETTREQINEFFEREKRTKGFGVDLTKRY